MIISELLTHLEVLKQLHGDIVVTIGESHEYWGMVYQPVDEDNVRFHQHTQPKGPKSGESEPGIIIETF